MTSKPIELEYELNTAQCVKVSLYMYREWQKAMEPPLFIYRSFPDWLYSLEQAKELPTKKENK